MKIWPAALACIVLIFAFAMSLTRGDELRAERVALVPAPGYQAPKPSGPQTAIFAGGCFWGVQGVFSHVEGVLRVEAGYAGGDSSTADYEKVSSGTTGHAEAVRIVYDPAKVSYGSLMRVFFSVVADPTTRDYQGPDHGSQYRSAIFPTTPDQKVEASRYLAQLGGADIWPNPIVTRIESGRFYPAEGYHQDFMYRKPDHPYIRAYDLPKLSAFRRLFPDLYRAQPVLTRKTG